MTILNPLPVQLPPGFYANGTRHDAAGRWYEGSLVRFVDGHPRAIGGWQRRTDSSDDPIDPLTGNPALTAPRDMISWSDNGGARIIALGGTLELVVVDAGGLALDITPASFTAGLKDSGLIDGYGTGPYGASSYGTPRDTEGLMPLAVGSWRLRTWGQDLLAAGPLGAGTELYSWTPGTITEADVVPNAPTDFADFLVTDERIVMVVGHGPNGRDVQWSDREDREEWTPDVTNQAGGKTLAGNGRLLAIEKVGTAYLILGEDDASVATYIRPPYVYSINTIATGCGCINAHSVVAVNSLAVWPGYRGFYMYDGAVRPLQCDVVDRFVRTRNRNELSKMHGFTIAEFNEIWWVYQSIDSTTNECDRYIAYNYVTETWTDGQLNRTVGMDKTVFASVMMLSPEGVLYNHEQRLVVLPDAEQARIRSGPIQIGVGGQIAHCDYVIPAMGAAGGADLYLHGRDGPEEPTRTSGPYTLRVPTPVKARGREIELELVGNKQAPSWSASTFRLNLFADGDR